MGFLAPWFLAGAAAIGLPLYIHMLRRHATDPRPFSSLMFFERRTQSSVKHRRLRYLMLLSLRLAVLLLLVLAFANPFINRSAASMSSDKLVLAVIDDSFSMRAGTRLADAKRDALALIAARKPAERLQVLSLGSQVHFLSSPTQDSGALRAAVDSVQPGDSRGNFGLLATTLRSMAETIRTPIELHLFSDLQRSGMPANFSEMALPANVSLVLHPVAGKDAIPNWSVESVTAPGEVWEPKKARVQSVIAGHHTPAASRTVSLIVAGKTIASKMVAVPADGRASVEFESLDVPYGFSRCEVRIDSADVLAADDAGLFAVQRSDPRQVLFVHEASDSRSALYFRSALASAAESAFTLDSINVEQTANAQQLSKYAFVVLSDVLSLPASFESTLANYVKSGGSVLVAAGTSTARRPRLPVFGDAVQESRYYSREPERFLTVGDADSAHASIGKADKWAGVKFYFAVRVDASNSRVVARLTDQTPLLLEKSVGEGRVLLLTSGLDNLTNDFPLHPSFVPFIEQTARYLSGTESRSSAHTVDSFLQLRNAKEQAVSVEVVDPNGKRPLSLKEAATAQSYQLTEAGFYQLRLASGRQDVVGVNPDPRESDLESIPEDVLALWRGNAHNTPEAASAGVNLQQEDKRFPLWWYVMLLVLLAAVAESLFASQYLGIQREDP